MRQLARGLTAGSVPAALDAVDVYWLPLGAGGHVVGWNGRVYERLCAWRDHRAPQDLYHAALQVWSDGTPTVIEMAPVWNLPDAERGVVVEGPVGTAFLGRSRWFRYEVRCWREGRIPDLRFAVGGAQRASSEAARSAAVLCRVREAPALVWGRDQLAAGEMWNSNSLVAWLLAGTGHEMSAIRPPRGGRAPGWAAGLALAGSEQQREKRT